MFRLVVLSLALVPCLGFHPGSVRSFARPQWSSLAPRTTTRDFLLAHDGAANDHSPSSVAAIPVALQGVPSSMARALSVRGGGLLKGLDPLLTADLLHVLRAAGHGDVRVRVIVERTRSHANDARFNTDCLSFRSLMLIISSRRWGADCIFESRS